ncbi:MAG: sulfatase [Planctomycetota bacterium]|jgi:arylsulfatase A-like enzyme
MKPFIILISAIIFTLPAPTWASQSKPNFVFILIDDMGWRDLGCFGSTFYETPNIDRLASEGMKFTNAYATCHVCSPTRASILTGLYPARLHLTDWLPGRPEPYAKLNIAKINQHLPHDTLTLPEILKQAGYASASIGKWHLGGKGSLPTDHGFDLNIAGSAAGHHAGMFFPYRVPIFDGEKGEFLTDRLTDEALKFIETNKDKPFFLYLPYYTVHRPLEAKPDRIARYKKKIKPGQKQRNPIFAAMIDSLDENIGRIAAKLNELGIDHRTIVIFVSDNGSLEHISPPLPLRAGKGTIYEGGLRVPTIIKWPRQTKANTVCHAPVISVDFYPTILHIAGIQPTHRLDGVSLVPLLKQEGTFKRKAIYWHYPHYSNDGLPPCGAVRMGKYKLIEFYEDNRLELYDLNQDISEKNNLATQMPDKAAGLAQMLDQWRTATKAQLNTPNANYNPAKTTWNRKPGK